MHVLSYLQTTCTNTLDIESYEKGGGCFFYHTFSVPYSGKNVFMKMKYLMNNKCIIELAAEL